MDAASLLAFRLQVQLDLEALFPAALTFRGIDHEIPAAGGNVKKAGQQLVPGGWMGDYDLLFRVRKALLPAVPELGATITFLDQPWKIMRINTPNSDVVYVFGCDNPNKQ